MLVLWRRMHLSWKRLLVLGVIFCGTLLIAGQLYKFSATTSYTSFIPGTDVDLDEEVPYTPAPKWVASKFSYTTNSRDRKDWNDQEMLDLRACLALDNCGPNQEKIALLATSAFEMGVIVSDRSGESVWGRSVYKALKQLGYTIFFSSDLSETLERYRMFPELVKIVITDNSGLYHLNPQCVKSESNPDGIPAWKIFEFAYWPAHFHRSPSWSMMGGEWILTSHPDDTYFDGPSPLQYIGFSIEETCPKHIKPLQEREQHIYMHMKRLRYLSDDKWSWDLMWFDEVAEELNATFIGGWSNEDNRPEVESPRIKNLGQLNDERFIAELAKSRVMLSMGNPYWSPSAWQALCWGVPVVQPITRWSESEPWNREMWELQQPSLYRYNPPYVYHVHAHNHTGFVEAMKAAYTTPIEPFIASFMTEAAVRDRVENLMETDWRYRGAELLVQRTAANNGSYIFQL